MGYYGYFSVRRCWFKEALVLRFFMIGLDYYLFIIFFVERLFKVSEFIFLIRLDRFFIELNYYYYKNGFYCCYYTFSIDNLLTVLWIFAVISGYLVIIWTNSILGYIIISRMYRFSKEYCFSSFSQTS